MRKTLLALSLAAMAFIVVGCAITDYDGYANHKTSAEAKLFGKEVAFTGAGSQSGTYSYTVKYDNRGGQGAVTINSYLNPGIVSFSRDGQIDRDGDDVQGNGGTAGGKFNTGFVAVDRTAGGGVNCEFSSNITQNKTGAAPGVSLCISGAVEEIDADFDLHAAFGSLDELLKNIWSGSLAGNFDLEVTAIVINGASIPVSTLPIGAYAAANRPTYFTINNGPGLQSVIQAVLANTNSGEPVQFGLEFAGGLVLPAPANVSLAFNHDRLSGLLDG